MSSSSSSSSSKICFNPDCKEPKSEPPRKGWRLRAGDFAELCDRCGSAYEEVRFCETFHSDVAGWRNCESCGKKVHCGCIASMHVFILLDAGGIECMACARKTFIMASNQIWPPSLFPPPPLPERLKDLPVKSWNQMTGPSSVPGPWWQGTNLWNNVTNQPDLRQRIAYDVDRPNNVDKLITGERSSPSAQEKKKVKDTPERMTSTSLKLTALDRLANGNVGADALATFSAFRKEESKMDCLQDAGHITGDDLVDKRKGINATAEPPGMNSSVAGMNISLSSSTPKDEPSTSLFGLGVSLSSPNETSEPAKVSGVPSQQQTPSVSLAKHIFSNSQNGGDSSVELQTQIRNGRPRGDGQRRNQLLPRYWPRITDQELQQITGDSNSVITPLFEKMLSASDAGRIGRLVLPKKCAEAYFPTISQSEGLPLKVQDATGKDWVFQFRFWPNNNSRMYVLEGVTPCIQSMQLQAGDTVTFSRIDPEGKLVMGFRKASSVSSEQDAQAPKTGNGFSSNGENIKNAKPSEVGSTFPLRPFKGGSESTTISSINHINPTDPAYPWSKFDKAGYIQKEGIGAKSSPLSTKRKNSILGPKSKRLRINNDDSMELKLTWEEAQDLLRPPPNHVPTIVVIEGHEFEEYEEAPVLGKPTIFTSNPTGEKNQWAQCEDCSKWRKLPLDAILPARWTCSDNIIDPKRNSCSAAQEITTEQLEDLVFSNIGRPKRSKTKEEPDAVEVVEGLDTLANLAILGEGEALPSSAQPTTKHPRHRPGCTCIVCIQPPSGKGPKHKQTCTCNVCLTVKRRFRTLMLRREKRQSEKEAERKKQQFQLPEKPELQDEVSGNQGNGSPSQKTVANGDDDDHSRRKSSSPFKGGIDLNIQPEREEEPSPVSDSGNMMRLLRDATELYLKQQSSETPIGSGEQVILQVEPSGSTGGERPNASSHKTAHPDADKDRPVSISMTMSASTSATG